ncbi:MAG: bifunctional UDP-N-acetylglucosamine diphosphorylase/glucosamine-1-phosphate N-acetyltransferase GlmU [Elusimicrobiota bacterium]|jgi:bifunctional UDP-N-acetylglucosamine pyrophosphorylase/glucosamine-1-phosphate N-acetyltransferase|nr:bifunctional UDP-N-acetylglucosamine diphosphorylase/glucosamine-1-phosphate N-acetyltransferase GlmU [Elusimicrobiota bacterium]
MVAKNNLCVLVLAGGKGTRMKSAIPKPLHKICGAEILSHILKEAQSLKPSRIGVLTGHQAELVRETVKNNLQNWGIKTPVDFILQKELTGSGTAAKDSVPFMRRYAQILILAGDAPLIRAATLKNLIQAHNRTKAACTVLTVDIDNPKGYGRVLKDAEGNFAAIIEESETNQTTAAIREINSGIYIFDVKSLLAALPLLKPQGPKKEYYLTDTLALLKQKGLRVEVFKAADYKEAMGINSKKQLADAAALMQAAVNDALMESGVTIVSPRGTYIESTVKIGADSVIYPNTFIKGHTVIGPRCVIGPNCWIEDSVLAEDVRLKTGCYLTQASLAKGCTAGPYAHLRPAAIIKENAKIGNFVEIKKSVIGPGSKVPHLTYVGDSEIGSKVNIGAGTITCNYDGVNKHKTVIGDGVFVGSNTNFVAPVVIGKGVKIGAGSTITQDIPAAMLAIARARQVNLIIKNKQKDKKK